MDCRVAGWLVFLDAQSPALPLAATGSHCPRGLHRPDSRGREIAQARVRPTWPRESLVGGPSRAAAPRASPGPLAVALFHSRKFLRCLGVASGLTSSGTPFSRSQWAELSVDRLVTRWWASRSSGRPLGASLRRRRARVTWHASRGALRGGRGVANEPRTRAGGWRRLVTGSGRGFRGREGSCWAGARVPDIWKTQVGRGRCGGEQARDELSVKGENSFEKRL